MARKRIRKPQRKKPASQPRCTAAESARRTAQVAEWLLSGTQRSEIVRNGASKWGIRHDQIDVYIRKARTEIQARWDEKVDADVEVIRNRVLRILLGHLTGLEEGVEGKDPRVQLQAAAQLVKLFGLDIDSTKSEKKATAEKVAELFAAFYPGD